MKKTIDRVDVSSRRVLMRVDFNVPLDGDGVITDDRRIRLALPSIRSVVDRGGRLVLMSHLGRPAGTGPEPGLSLRPAADRLRELLEPVTVRFVPDDCVGDAAVAAVQTLGPGEVLVLENLRFHKEEKKGDAGFAARLAAFADIYCNEAFGTAHRKDASMYAVPETLAGKPRVCGFLLSKEIQYLSETIEAASSRAGADASGRFVAVLGGAKVSDKLGAIRNLLGRVDDILIGGAMAYTFLVARGGRVGASRVEQDMIDAAGEILAGAEGSAATIGLPGDHVCGRELAAGTATEILTGDIEEGWMGLDIGPATAGDYAAVLARAGTIVWNGPMGVFETPPFDAGTRAVAEAVAASTAAGAVSVVGGGDTAAAVEAFGLAGRVSHVSTGGGASLQMLEGRPFASVALLDEA